MPVMEGFATRQAWSACLVGVVGVFVSLLPATLRIEEDPGLRWLFALRGPVEPPPSVAVVAISRDSAEAFGVSDELDEWPRGLHARAIERLDELGAALIVFDVMFDEPRNEEEDGRLAAAMAEAGNVVLLEWVETDLDLPVALPPDAVLERRKPPHEPFTRAALATAPFTLPTRPLRTSQFWAFGRTDDSVPNLPSVALAAHAASSYEPLVAEVRRNLPSSADPGIPPTIEAARATGLAGAVRKLRLAFVEHPNLAMRVASGLAARAVAKDEAIHALVDLYGGPSARYLSFYGPTRTIETIPFERLIADETGESLRPDLEGRVVFVGYSERRQPSQADDFISVYSEASGLNLSGVEIAATAFANLLERRSLKPVRRWLHLLWLFVWGTAATWGLGRLRTSTAIVVGLASGAALLGFAVWRLAVAGVWWPTVVPLGVQLPLALCLVAYWSHRRLNVQRERIQTALGYYVPSHVLDNLVRDSSERDIRRELVYGTCLVSDAEHFTTLSEQIGAEALGDLMERYYQALAQSVQRHGGFVADVSGDSIVAIWTNMRSRTESKRRACRAALEMCRAIEAFNVEHAPRRLPTRFGLDSGEVVIGNIGIARRYEYRAVGDIVNTASRIQGLNRLLGTQVLASAASSAGAAGPGSATRPMGRFMLLGKTTPIEVHEVLAGDRLASTGAERFECALTAFAERRWDEARKCLRDVLAVYPDDGPSLFYLAQCDRYETAVLDPGWAGTIEMTVK